MSWFRRSRFCATILRPFCSKRWLIAPVKLRRVASGLMIDRVRTMAMEALAAQRKGAGYSETQSQRQSAGDGDGLRLFLPAGSGLLPVGQGVASTGGAAPALARHLDCGLVVALEHIRTALEAG